MRRDAVTIETGNGVFIIIPSEISYISCIQKGKNRYDIDIIMKYTSNYPAFTVGKRKAEEILKILAPKTDKSNFLDHMEG